MWVQKTAGSLYIPYATVIRINLLNTVNLSQTGQNALGILSCRACASPSPVVY